MGFRDLFFGGRSSASTTSVRGNRNLKVQAYDSAIALDAPVRGSYPVAGNGPNVFDEIQRSRAKKDAKRRSTISRAPSIRRSIAEPPPDIPLFKSATIFDRPQTAPHNSVPRARYNIGVERTSSGFSTKSPPTFYFAARCNTPQSTPESYASPIPATVNVTPMRDIKAYQPTKGVDLHGATTEFKPPFAHHQRSDSAMSHKSYVDILDAQSSIKSSRETSRHRAKASGVRDYGEDVADRNIADFGSGTKAIDLNSPDFSYMKTVYSSKPPKGFSRDANATLCGQGQGEALSTLPLGQVLGPQIQATGSGDDMSLIQQQDLSTHTIVESATSNSCPPNPVSCTVDASSIRPYSHNTIGGHDDHCIVSNQNDQNPRSISALSEFTPSVDEEGPEDSPPSPPPTRGRTRIARQDISSVTTDAPVDRRQSIVKISNPVPISIIYTGPRTASSIEVKHYTPPVSEVASIRTRKPEARKGASVSFSDAPPENILPVKYPLRPLKDRRRTMSGDGLISAMAGHKRKSGSISYSSHPSTASRGSLYGSINLPTRPSTAPNRKGIVVEDAKESPNLEKVVDLTNTVDTDITTKILPAVTHEQITPTIHKKQEEFITREIHTHDVYHRMLPVIETIILPTKHYIPSTDGKSLVEIPVAEVSASTGRPLESINESWRIVKSSPSARSSFIKRKPVASRTSSFDTQELVQQTQLCDSDIHKSNALETAQNHSNSDDPTMGLVSVEVANRTPAEKTPEPTLSSQKTFMTECGYPRTEYVWCHPPVFEDVQGRTQPIYMDGILSNESSNFSIASSMTMEIHTTNPNSINANGLPFRDSHNPDSTVLNTNANSPTAILKQSTDIHSASLTLGATERTREEGPGSTLEEKIFPVASSMHPEMNRLNPPSQPTLSKTSGDRVLTGELDDKMKLGRVLNDKSSPHSNNDFKTGQATKFLHRLKEKRRSSSATSSVFRTWSKRSNKNNRMSLNPGTLEQAVGDQNDD